MVTSRYRVAVVSVLAALGGTMVGAGGCGNTVASTHTAVGVGGSVGDAVGDACDEYKTKADACCDNASKGDESLRQSCREAVKQAVAVGNDHACQVGLDELKASSVCN